MMKRKINRQGWRNIKLLVIDFDGVMTDDFVYMDDRGKEFIRCSRSDGLGLSLVKREGIKIAVISREKNPVVCARCRKLKIPAFTGVENKIKVLRHLIKSSCVSVKHTCYVGNDITDIDCVKFSGIGCAVNNAHPLLLRSCDYVTKNKGGQGAIREICDLILEDD